MRKIITLFFILINCGLNAQSLNLAWAKQMGGTSVDMANAMKIDASGNIYLTGFFYNTVDFDMGTGTHNLTSVGSGDVFVQKLDADGNLIWVRQMGGSNDDLGNGLAVDGSGNVYTVGTFYGVVDFDPGAGVSNLTAVGNSDIFIQKLNANGDLVWAKQIGGINSDGGGSVSVDADGNVFVAGSFSATADFDPGAGVSNLTASGIADAFILKLDVNGNLTWVKQIGGACGDGAGPATFDASGNVYSSIKFCLTADLDPGSGTYNFTSAGGSDIALLKLDAAGNFVWAKQIGGSSDDQCASLTIDKDGNLVCAGKFQNTTDLDPGIGVSNFTSAGLGDIFIEKLDANGNMIWVKQIGGTADDSNASFITDASGDIYGCGGFQSTVDFDPGSAILNFTSAGSVDIFILKMDTNGNLTWAKQMGGTGSDWCADVAPGLGGNIYSAGFFWGTSDLDPESSTSNFTSAGLSDIYVQKLGDLTTAVSYGNTNSEFKVYPNPSSGDFVLDLNGDVASVTVYNAQGIPVYSAGNTSETLNVNLSPGIYIVNIKSNSRMERIKLIVQ